MRLRTFILLILVLLLAAVLVFFLVARGGGIFSGLLGGGGDGGGVPTPAVDVSEPSGAEPGLPAPTPTPTFETVVVAKLPIPVGYRLTEDMLVIEQRPTTNVALQGGYVFTDVSDVVGKIARVQIARGQEILTPMLALDPTDVAQFGSDLALFIPFGEVAVAFPIDAESGAAFAMRPGDKVDLIMTMQVVNIDPVFRSALPNKTRRVLETQLLLGGPFLFPPIEEGRLEFIPEINQVAAIIPGGSGLGATDLYAGDTDFTVPDSDYAPGEIIPKRITQLTIQQSTVLFVGDWVDPREEALQQALAATAGEGEQVNEEGTPIAPTPTATPFPQEEEPPNIVILSMSPQDALTLQFAQRRQAMIDLALRSPGDSTVFVTTSVSLAQMIDQGVLALPEQSDIDLFNPAYDSGE